MTALEVTMKFLAESLVFEKCAPFFGREDHMQKDLCERLRHD
jgi:hypothetical protein